MCHCKPMNKRKMEVRVELQRVLHEKLSISDKGLLETKAKEFKKVRDHGRRSTPKLRKDI